MSPLLPSHGFYLIRFWRNSVENCYFGKFSLKTSDVFFQDHSLFWPYLRVRLTQLPLFATVMYLDHLLTNSIMITFASVINENIVHMGIERYILNYLSKTLSGHPFYCYYYYYYYYFFHLFHFLS